LSEASWAGARIILGQWTPYTEKLFDLLILVFGENGTITDVDALKEKSGLSTDEWDRLLEFSSQVIAYPSARAAAPRQSIGLTDNLGIVQSCKL